jgi:hypothetical protein
VDSGSSTLGFSPSRFKGRVRICCFPAVFQGLGCVRLARTMPQFW